MNKEFEELFGSADHTTVGSGQVWRAVLVPEAAY